MKHEEPHSGKLLDSGMSNSIPTLTILQAQKIRSTETTVISGKHQA